MARNKKERVRNYLKKQCEANLPATYQGFVSENPETDITSSQFSDSAYHLKTEFENDPQKAKWYNSIRKGLNRLTNDEIAKYFPQRIHINTAKNDVRTYLNEQCAKKLPATYLDFKTKNPNTKIIRTQDFLTYVSTLKKEFMGTPERKYWFNEIRANREKLNPEQVPLYYTRKYIAGCVPQVNEYLLKQCAHHLPGTYRGFKSEHPKTKITSTQFCRAVEFLRSDFEKDREKADWFNTVRTSPDGLTLDEIAKYFPKKIHLETSRHEVRKYLNEQCAKKLPATYLDFKKKHPKTKIENPSTFGSYVAQVKIEFMETPERKGWFNEIRANKENLDPEQASLYYDSSRKFVTGSNTDQIRQYLLGQCAQSLPGTYAGFLAQSPDSSTTLRQFNDSVKYLKGEFAKDPKLKHWMENIRLKKEGLTSEQKRLYFPPKIMPGETEFVRQFLKQQRLKMGDVTFETFHMKFPNSTLTCDDFFDVIYTKLKSEYLQDADSKKWFEDKFPSRASRSEFTGHIGTAFDKCMVAGLYSPLRDRGIPIYHQTTNFVQTGHHPKRGRLRNDRRVELRMFTRDLLNLGKNIGPALQKFLRNANRPELVVDVSLSSNYGKKILKYVDPSTCLLIINPDGTNGQQPIEPYVRVLSFSEFFGPQWLNLDLVTIQKLLGDLNLALKAIRSGPASQADQDLRASMETKWNQVKAEIKTNASQVQYESRVLQEISEALRYGEIPKQLEGYVQAAREAGHDQLAAKLELLARAMAAIGKTIRKKKDGEKSGQYSGEKEVNEGNESRSQNPQEGGAKEKQQMPVRIAATHSDAKITPQNSTEPQNREEVRSGSTDTPAETWARCAAMFPDRRRLLQQRLLEEELAWEAYTRQVAVARDGGTPLQRDMTDGGILSTPPPTTCYHGDIAPITSLESSQASSIIPDTSEPDPGVPTPEDTSVAPPIKDQDADNEDTHDAATAGSEVDEETGKADEDTPEQASEATQASEEETGPVPEETKQEIAQSAAKKIPEPAIEVASNGGMLLLAGGDPGDQPAPHEGGSGGQGSEDGNDKPSPGGTRESPRGDGPAIHTGGDGTVQVTGSDLQSIRTASAYGDGALVMGKDGSGVLLSPDDTRNIRDALSHVQQSLNNARNDVTGPDPSTRINLDGRDISGTGPQGTRITGDDLHAIHNAGKHKSGLIIHGENGSLLLNEKDTQDISKALDHTRGEIAAARPPDAEQSVDGPVVNEKDIKNANPSEHSYPIHDPRPARGQVNLKSDDLRDIYAAGRGEVSGDVVIATSEGPKVVSRKDAEGITLACERLQQELGKPEAEIAIDPASNNQHTGGQDDPIDREEFPGYSDKSGQDSKSDPIDRDEFPGYNDKIGQDNHQDENQVENHQVENRDENQEDNHQENQDDDQQDENKQDEDQDENQDSSEDSGDNHNNDSDSEGDEDSEDNPNSYQDQGSKREGNQDLGGGPDNPAGIDGGIDAGEFIRKGNQGRKRRSHAL